MIPRCYHLGLIGYPLGHSRSPVLHHAALAAAGLEGEYRLFPIPPSVEGTAQIGSLIKGLRQGELHGLNITIPHKQTVLPFLDRRTTVAQAVGAVNTIFIDSQGQATGDNTDVPGFLRDLQRLVGSTVGSALVLGAGGSARAVVFALSQAGWRIHVIARREEQAAALIAEIGVSAQTGPLTEQTLAKTSIGCDLLVNTTPLGMFPEVGGCPWPEDLPLPPRAAIYDLVYNPVETVLLRRARQAGLPAVNGSGMLIAQAALAFQRWTGLEPPFEIMERAFKE